MKNLTMLSFLLIVQLGLLHAQSWNITGNAGTNPGTNFLGTTDARAFMMKVNNQKSGFIDYSSAATTSFGYQTLHALTSGKANTSLGYQALFSNTTGSYNTATGQFALFSNTTGGSNTANGIRSLYANTNGSFNTAIGNRALSFNTSGNDNIAIGNRAAYLNKTGYSNIAIGTDALNKNTAGKNLVAIGDSSMFNASGSNVYSITAVGSKTLYNNIGGLNSAFGAFALYSNTFSPENTAIGAYALYSNGDYGYRNTAVGTNALYANTRGELNSAFGVYALYHNQDGIYNSAVGVGALENSTTGDYNTAVGNGSLGGNVTGSFNTGLGFDANVYYPSALNNATAIGYGVRVTASNQVMVGNTSVTSIGGQVGWTNFSDERIKQDVKENVPGLNFIKALKPVTYHFNLAKEYALLGKKDSAVWQGKNDIEKMLFTGLIAQEVDAAAKKINYDFSGVDKTGKIWGLRYADFVVPLIKSMQELAQQNDSLKSKNNELEARLAKLEAVVFNNQSKMAADASQMAAVTSYAKLEQNVPNPFNSATAISYALPISYKNAAIEFYAASGALLKSITINAKGNGTVILKANELPSGVYNYALVIDGKIAGSKVMIRAK